MQDLNSSSREIIRVTYARVTYTVCRYAINYGVLRTKISFLVEIHESMLFDDSNTFRFFSGVDLPFLSRTDTYCASVLKNIYWIYLCLMRFISSLNCEVSLFEKYQSRKDFSRAF